MIVSVLVALEFRKYFSPISEIKRKEMMDLSKSRDLRYLNMRERERVKVFDEHMHYVGSFVTSNILIVLILEICNTFVCD